MPLLPIDTMHAINAVIRSNLPKGRVFYFMTYDPEDGSTSVISSSDDVRDLYPLLREIMASGVTQYDVPADSPSWYRS